MRISFVQAALPGNHVTVTNRYHPKGYIISRVQHVDKGLTARGYKTRQYKVVFFNRAAEIANIKHNYPHLIFYIPLSITIIEKPDHVAISTVKPKSLSSLFQQPVPESYFHQWDRETKQIFEEFQSCKL